jgi:gluconolactonase
MRLESDVELLVGDISAAEGPAFDRVGNLYFVDWEQSSVVKLTPDGEKSEFFNTGGIPAGLAFHPDGSLYVADEGANIHGILRISADGAESKILVNEYQGVPLNGANDLVFDRNGVLYFSDPWQSSAENPVGGFYRLFPDGRLEQLDSGLAFPNGVALDAGESYVYLAETYRNRILRYPISSDGSIGSRQIWAEVGIPPGADGMAFDVDGFLFVAHFSGQAVDVFGHNGKLVDQIRVPGKQPTNVAFGGPDNRTLVITEVETHAVYRVQLSVAGQKLNDGR